MALVELNKNGKTAPQLSSRCCACSARREHHVDYITLRIRGLFSVACQLADGELEDGRDAVVVFVRQAVLQFFNH